MASPISWLHLSDLHACNPRTGWDAGDVLADLRRDLVRLRDEHGLTPDLVFFTGDAGFGHLGQDGGKSLAEQPAWRFGKTRHRPDVIDRVLVTLDEAEAVRLADEAR